MDSHPSCRRPHKLPAHTFKEQRNRPQRLHPCPDVSVEVSRTLCRLVLEVSTPRCGVFIFPSAWRRTAFVEVSRTLCRLFSDPSTPCEGPFVSVLFGCESSDSFPPREPPIIGGFRRTATPFFEGFSSGPAAVASRRRPVGGGARIVHGLAGDGKPIAQNFLASGRRVSRDRQFQRARTPRLPARGPRRPLASDAGKRRACRR